MKRVVLHGIMHKIDALILAGAPAGPELDPDGPLNSRAMVDIGGKTMLQRVIDALRGCDMIGRIVAVGDVSGDGLDSTIESGSDLMDNIRRGLEALAAADRVLVCSSDVPLLTADAVSDFLGRALKLDVDLAYPVIGREQCEKAYPGIHRTYLKTADGTFTGGNLMLVKPDFIKNNWDIIAESYAARKQVARLARMIGLGVLLRVIVGQVVPAVVRLEYLEAAVSRLVRAKVAAVVSSYPEIGEDVDKPSDLEAVRRILASSGAG